MSLEREKLIRQAFELERDNHYPAFRRNHWDVPEIVAACPDLKLREKVLRAFWNQDAEERYEEYRASVAGLDEVQLRRLSGRVGRDVSAWRSAKLQGNAGGCGEPAAGERQCEGD